MSKTACFTAVGALLINGAFVPPAFSQDSACTVSQQGQSFVLQAMDAKGKPLSDIADGYHLSVTVNGDASGPAAPHAQTAQSVDVLVDTGSTALAVPAWKIGNFPANPENDTSGVVISNLQKYGYSSSENNYYGYVIQASVKVRGAGSPSFEARDVQVFAITKTCGTGNVCTPLTSKSAKQPGMMGVGFQPPKLTVDVAGGQPQPATHTNVFAQVPGVQTQGWIFSTDGRIVVGLNSATAANFSGWAPMVQASSGGLSPAGCVYVTEPNQSKPRKLCGTILVDTGMTAMNMWVNSGETGQDPFCASPPTSKAGFNGAPLSASSTVAIQSPRQSPILDYSFTAGAGSKTGTGTPTGTYCSNVTGQTNPDVAQNAHFNIGRMPLQVYSLARNQTCGTYAFLKGPIQIQK
ncbi:hypothetical protein [Burkholderia perseverans]|uniref:hypothetical protein n=1 Tax=Burkholderia perseverans TaxID=2615214 RepID=UPI001FED2DCF|nr:hypothetical protein [Burkholderia perseverans]